MTRALQQLGTVYEHRTDSGAWSAMVGIDTARVVFESDLGHVVAYWQGLPGILGHGQTPAAAFLSLMAASREHAGVAIADAVRACATGTAAPEQHRIVWCAGLLDGMRSDAHTLACVLLGARIDDAGRNLAAAITDAEAAARGDA